MEETEELDTSDEPLLRREPFTERRDLLSVSRSLREYKQTGTFVRTQKYCLKA